jgi:tRNA(His) 5'-end guanylyltransferase
MNKDNLGDRIKKYESSSKSTLLPRGYIVLRVDGKAFHTFTKNMEKPFDKKLTESMIRAGERVSKEMMGFKLGYHQSDEFTFAITDTDSFESQLWFDGEVQKLCSVTASMFGAYFNKEMEGTEAIFDCRAFNVPIDDVPNVFIWRQRDWEKNSIQMLSRSLYSTKDLHLKNTSDMHEMLYKKGINWSLLEDVYKNGTFITKDNTRIQNKLIYSDIEKLLSTPLPVRGDDKPTKVG